MTQIWFDYIVVFSIYTLIFFQITIALVHRITIDSIYTILETLVKTINQVFIIFTILEDCISNDKVSHKTPAENILMFDT